MTTTIKVTAHCAADTEVRFGKTTQTIVKLGLAKELAEIVTLQDGESAEKYVYDDQVVVVLERKKVPTEALPTPSTETSIPTEGE